MFKLVGFDLDNTLLNEERKISSNSFELLEELKSMIQPVIVTGRGFNSASRFFKERNVDIDIICNNGNVIRNSLTDKLYYVNEIDKKDVDEIIKNCNNKNIYPLVHINAYEDGYDVAFVEKNCSKHVNTYPKAFGNRVLKIDNFQNLDKGVLSIIFAGEYEDLKKVKNEAEKKYSNNFNIHLLEVKSKNLYILEILQKSGNKWNGMKEYMKMKNISRSETIAVGDDYNDISMIENAGIGIAMKNASKSVKDSADIITEYDNNNDGAIKAVLNVLKVR